MNTAPKPSRKRYLPPAVIYEAALQVRAGSPTIKLPIKPDLTDPAKLWKK